MNIVVNSSEYPIYQKFNHTIQVTAEQGETNVVTTVVSDKPLPSGIAMDKDGVRGEASTDIFTDVSVVAEYILKGVDTRQTPIKAKTVDDIPPAGTVILTAFHPSRMLQIVYNFTVTVEYDKTTTTEGTGGGNTGGTSTTEHLTETKTFTITVKNNWERGRLLLKRYI
ncbi:hypothetical protein VPHD528_0057 [Vibrio phage D528]